MKNIILIRTKELPGVETLGDFFVYENGLKLFESRSLELPYRDNRRNVSCIPEGIYNIVLEWSPKYNSLLWELKGVPNRSEIKVHWGNYREQTQGCILLGMYYDDINRDGIPDLKNSYKTVDRFHKSMRFDTRAVIKIINAYD